MKTGKNRMNLRPGKIVCIAIQALAGGFIFLEWGWRSLAAAIVLATANAIEKRDYPG